MPRAAPRFADVTRPDASNAGGAESMLAASPCERVRHCGNVTRAPFQATRRWPGSGLAYQLVSAVNDPTSVASLSRNAEPSRSAFVYAKRLLRASSCAALT